MSWKKTDLERLKAASLTDQLKRTQHPDRYGKGSHAVSRREQRKRDQAQGLVPFAVKLNGTLVERLRTRAEHEGRPLNELVNELLEGALDRSSGAGKAGKEP